MVSGGVLAVNNLADGGNPSSLGASSSAAANLVLDGGTLRLGNANALPDSRALTVNGGLLDLNGFSKTITSLDGTDGPFGGNALASNGHLHEAALAFLGASPDDDDPDMPRRQAGSVRELRPRE